MSKYVYVIIITVLMQGVTCAYAQGKTTIDPNSIPKLATKIAVDERLSQKINYDSGYTRLHYVAEYLAKTSHVDIRSGKIKSDWKSRDIPVFVYSRDLPLGTLLQALADATHLRLSSEIVKDDKGNPTKSYRLIQNYNLQKQLEDYIKACEEFPLKRALWQWDAAAKIKDVPAYKRYAQDGNRAMFRQCMSELISALGTETRDKIISGETIKFTIDNAPDNLKGIIDRLFKAELDTDNRMAQDYKEYEYPSEDDWKKCYVYLRYENGRFSTPVRDPFRRTTYWGLAEAACSGVLGGMPREPEPPALDDSKLGLRRLSNSTDFNADCLKVKVSLDPPKDIDDPTYADLFAALSQASGFSIIGEDFLSHQKQVNTKSLFKHDTTLGEVLNQTRYQPDRSLSYYLDEKDKIIIITDAKWPDAHDLLVSEDRINFIRAKADGTGLNLDDILATFDIPSSKKYFWLIDAKDPITDMNGYPIEIDMWMLYSKLTPQEKAAVLSEAGLNLSLLDPELTMKAIKDCNAYLKKASADIDDEVVKKFRQPIPEDISSMVMKIKYDEIWFDSTGQGYYTKADSSKPALKKQNYYMLLESQSNGETAVKKLGGFRLPIYSQKRFNELTKQLDVKK